MTREGFTKIVNFMNPEIGDVSVESLILVTFKARGPLIIFNIIYQYRK